MVVRTDFACFRFERMPKQSPALDDPMIATTTAPSGVDALPSRNPRSGEEGGASLNAEALATLLKRLETSDTGLTAAQVADRARKFGLNDPAPVRRATA